MNGPFGPGLHVLIGLAFVVFWVVVVAAFLAALYFVIRLAVTHAIVRADAHRAAPPKAAAEHPGAPHPAPRTPATHDPAREDPTPPDVRAS